METKNNNILWAAIIITIFSISGSAYYSFNNSCKKDTKEVVKTALNLPASMGGAEGKSSLIDLNSDGQLDLIIQPIGGNYCGTGGCTTLIFKNTGNNLELVNEIALTRDVYVSTTNTNGWLDLITTQSGGGMPEAKNKKLQFNGLKYPMSAEEGSEATISDTDKKIF